MGREETSGAKPVSVMLKNSKTGVEKEFILRPFKDGDEKGMMACIRAEYGDSYFKPYFYDEAWIREHAKSGDYDFFVGEADGEIAGMEIFTHFSEIDECVEPASQILAKEYRGYGLSIALVNYTYDILEAMDIPSIFVHAVTFHSFTQGTCEKRGMFPVGFRLGRFLTEKMKNSYPKGHCDKHSEGIMIEPVKKREAGVIYLPEELAPFGKKIYDRIGVLCEIRTSGEVTDTLPAEGEYRIKVDESQEFIEVLVINEGLDLAEKMTELVKTYRGKGYYSIQIALYDDTPTILKNYEELKKAGYFFTGFKPVCGKREQLYMQWVDDWNLCMEDYVLTDSFAEIREYIQEFYKNRHVNN